MGSFSLMSRILPEEIFYFSENSFGFNISHYGDNRVLRVVEIPVVLQQLVLRE